MLRSIGKQSGESTESGLGQLKNQLKNQSSLMLKI